MMTYTCEIKPGTKFGRLTFLELANRNDKSRQWYWKCRCDCGNERTIMGSNVKNGRSLSCGCLQKQRVSETITTHGKSGTKLHRTWKNIKQRCFNERHPRFCDYGGRGITMAEEWKNSFERFAADVGEPPTENHSLDREDNNKSYEPGNVRWATDLEQHRNRRISVHVNGDSLQEFCDTNKVDYQKAYTLIVRRKIPANIALSMLKDSIEPSIS